MKQCQDAVTAAMDVMKSCNDECNRILHWLSERIGHNDARVDVLERRVHDLEARLARNEMILAEVLPWSNEQQ